MLEIVRQQFSIGAIVDWIDEALMHAMRKAIASWLYVFIESVYIPVGFVLAAVAVLWMSALLQIPAAPEVSQELRNVSE